MGCGMERLTQGYRSFREQQWPERRDVFERLALGGQAPHTMVVACSDSRVDPTMIFSAEPGELFVLRNVANLVPPYQPDSAFHSTSAALEFAVRVLEVQDLIVMGHAMCGGIGYCSGRRPTPRANASGKRSSCRWTICSLFPGYRTALPKDACVSPALCSTYDRACWLGCSRTEHLHRSE